MRTQSQGKANSKASNSRHKNKMAWKRRDSENESFTTLMTTLYNPENDFISQMDIVDSSIEIRSKKITKLTTSLEKRKLINKRLLASLKKKKEDLSELNREIKDVYKKVSIMSIDLEEGFIERENLKKKIAQDEKKHTVIKRVLNETYKELKLWKEIVQKKDIVLKELTEKTTSLEKEKKDLKILLQETKAKNDMLMDKFTKKNNDKEMKKRYDGKALTTRDQNGLVKMEQ